MELKTALLVLTLFLTINANAEQCYNCSSNVDRECATRGIKDKVVQCPGDCGTTVDRTTLFTIRGCLKDVNGKGDLIEKCSGKLCNGELFPKYRFVCHQCSGGTCAQKPGEALGCVRYVEGDECYHGLDTKKTTFVRGCMSDANKVFDAKTSTKCFGNGCNNATQALKQFKCFSCNSAKDAKCSVKKGAEGCATDDAVTCAYESDSQPTGKCYSYVTSAGVQRGCVKDLKEDLTKKPGYVECTKELCNKCNKEPEVKKVCANCNSKDDLNCLESPKQAKTVECPKKDDTCAWQVKNGVVYQGCKSSFANFTVSPGSSGECKDSHCFEEKELSNAVCYTCNSKDFAKCEEDPKKYHAFAQVCPHKDDTCVWKVEGGVLFRGCKSSFKNFTVVAGVSGECKGSKCNSQVHHVEVKCYACTSKDNEECLKTPGEDTVKKCPKSDDICVWKIDGEVLYRGCKSEMPKFTVSPGISGECSGSLCNQVHIGDTRLGCYQCTGPDCLMSPGTVQLCKTKKEGDKCFLDVIDEKNVTRGCLSDKVNCVGKFCYKCDTFGCNNQPGKGLFQCASCRSYDTNDCVRADITPHPNATKPTKDVCLVNNEVFCHHDTLFGHPQKCFTYHELDVIVRGCSKDMPKKIRGNKNIVECFGINCNRDCIARQKCTVCDSRQDPRCKNDIDHLELQECPDEYSSCHTCEGANGTIVRGCGASSVDKDLKCNFCQGTNGCNNDRKPVSCYTCDSRYDPNCARWTKESSVEQCPHPDDQCIWKIAAEYTMRGCSSKVRDCIAGDVACGSCREDKCNGGIKPDNRLLCHQCEGPGCVEKIGAAVACEYYKPGDKCFTGIIDERNIVRGCMSDKIDRCLSLEKCYICSVGGCNRSPFVAPMFQKPQF